MENRRYERVNDNLDAEIILDHTSYSGIVMNFSETGLHLVTATLFEVEDLTSEKMFDLKCKLPSGNTVDMNCELKWFSQKNSPYGVSFCMGMEIKDPPSEYREFVKTSH